MGLLVAGIMGGSSLIKSAKIQKIINETKQYEQAIYTFYSLKNRLPGDTNNLGLIGKNSQQIYNNNSFGGNYVSSNKEYGIPHKDCAPFVDLYLAGITNFEPKK